MFLRVGRRVPAPSRVAGLTQHEAKTQGTESPVNLLLQEPGGRERRRWCRQGSEEELGVGGETVSKS